MKFLKLSLAAAVLATLSYANPIVIGSGSPTGNYFGMTNDIVSENYCASVLPEGSDVQNTDGSVANLLGITNKKYAVGIVQSDVLMNLAKTMPRKVNQNSVKIIAGMHIETIHLLVPNGYAPKQKSGGLFSNLASRFSDKNTGPISLSELKDQEVSSWGGSLVSSRALSYFFDLNWEVKAIDSANALATKTPILLTGGQPYAPVEKLLASGKWKLLSLDYNTIRSKAPFYVRSDVTYRVNGNPTTVATIGVQALLIGKSYRKESRNKIMNDLASCIDTNLADLADDGDTNPNWGSVYENNNNGNQMNWQYFKLN